MLSTTRQESLADYKFLHVLSLTEGEQEVLANLASCIDGNPYSDFESFYQSIIQRRTHVPERVARKLHEFRSSARGGALLIQGVPLDNTLPPTPREPFAINPIFELRTEVYLVLLATLVAEPFSYKEWDSGYMVHNKYPISSHREVQFGSNAVEFLVHTETPFRDMSPDYLALLCLRGDPTNTAKTRLGDIGQIIEELSEAEFQVLQGPFFAFETDNPAIIVEEKLLTFPMPIVTNRDGRIVFEYVHDLVAITKESQVVLEKLKARIEATTIELSLETGNLLIIDNSHMVHGRSAYVPKYDGTDRWLQRQLLSTRLFNQEAMPESRLISDRQLNHYPTAYRNVLQNLGVAE